MTNNRSSFDIEAGDRNGDWSESYIIRLFDWHLKEQETVLVQAELVDKDGIRCLDACNFIEFGCTDNKALLQHQGTVRGSRRIQVANGLASICVNKANAPIVVSAYDSKRTLKSALITVIK